MLLSSSPTMSQIDAAIGAPSAPGLPRLWRMVAEHRRRQLDRAVADAVLLLDHPGIADDLRVARGPYSS